MDPERRLHVVHLLIRNRIDGSVGFLVYPHHKWKDPEGRSPLHGALYPRRKPWRNR